MRERWASRSAGVLVLLFAVAGCGGRPPCFCRVRTAAIPPSPAAAQLTFLSPSNTTQVYVFHMANGQLLATSGLSDNMTVQLPPGSHQLLLVSRASTEVIQANVAPGRRYFVLVRYLAVPFGPDFGVQVLNPQRPEWARLQTFLNETTAVELDPASLDPRRIDRFVRRLERRIAEGQSRWAQLSSQQRIDRTLQPGDGI